MKIVRSFKFIILRSFSSPVEPIQVFGVDHIPFPSFLMISHAGAPHNLSPLAIQLFRSVEDISKIRVFHSTIVQTLSRMLSHSSHLIQPVLSPFQVIFSTVFLLNGP